MEKPVGRLLLFIPLELKVEVGKISHCPVLLQFEYLSLDVILVDPSEGHR